MTVGDVGQVTVGQVVGGWQVRQGVRVGHVRQEGQAVGASVVAQGEDVGQERHSVVAAVVGQVAADVHDGHSEATE